jgi:hypothetical protein
MPVALAAAKELVAVGNATKALNFAYGQSGSGEANNDLATGPVSLFSIEGWLSEADSGGAAMPRPPLVVSMTLLAQRQAAEDSLLAQVDALDISAASCEGGASPRPLDIEV